MASSLSSLGLVLTLVFVATGCNQAAASEVLAKASGKATEPAHTAAAAAAPAPAHTDSHGSPASPGSAKYGVPFAWELSPAEPLSVARAFLGEALRDNRAYSNQGAKVFAEYRDHQKPRATVVTCADSRVHTGAFDATPENDVFMIKNIGNQIGNAEGSVEYGVAHFGTPVLLVIGHTGCGAVKAALGDLSKQSKAVRAELEHMTLPKPEHKSEKDEKTVWADAVIANVHQQVKKAVRTFGERVQQGNLTVVGAVYDFRNDLGNGAGKLTIVDVNGNDDPERMKAFVAALGGSGSSGRAPSAAHRYSPGSVSSPRELASVIAELEARQKKANPASH
jgi:carbonic anhydrase